VVHTLFGLTYMANAPPADRHDRSSEWRVSSSENLTDASVWQSRRGAVVTSPPPALHSTSSEQASRGRSTAATTLSDDKIKNGEVKETKFIEIGIIMTITAHAPNLMEIP